jgi:hypothetical protein
LKQACVRKDGLPVVGAIFLPFRDSRFVAAAMWALLQKIALADDCYERKLMNNG